MQRDEHTASAVSEQELPTDWKRSSVVLKKQSRDKEMAFFVPVVLSACFCILPFSLYFVGEDFDPTVEPSSSTWLLTFWWDDIGKLLRGNPELISVILCLVFVLSRPSVLRSLINHSPDCRRLLKYLVIPIFTLGYWLALLLGLVRIVEGSGMILWPCLFTLALMYHCTTVSLRLLFYLETEDTCTFVIFFLGLMRFIYLTYLQLFTPLTGNMKQFLVVEVMSMATFSYYSWFLTAPTTRVVSRMCLCTGWTLSICFLYECHCTMAIENREERDRACQNACWYSVWMDVGGKLFTYCCVVSGTKTHLPQWVALLEFAATLIEAIQKWAHAWDVHAREVLEVQG
eukprot:s90_g7.t1